MIPETGPGLLAATSPDGLLFWLLLAGHLLGDFLLQTRAMLAHKDRDRGLLAHATTVLAVHAAVLAPMITLPAAGVLVAVAGTHAAIDRTKARWRRQVPGPLGLFLADQALHVGVLFGAYVFLGHHTRPLLHLPVAMVEVWTLVALMAGGFAFNANGGSAIVEATLASLGPGLGEEDRGEPGDGGVPGSGRVIGIVERTLALILILLGQWAMIGLLLTAKSIARFEALKRRRFAEYYLIGTLVSLLVAVLTGLALGWLLGTG